MAFKGTHTRNCQQINLDAERLGAEVNAHTDKDHTAYHMRGLARDAARFVRMLGDIVRNGSFPEAELERERQVILHEYIEDEDDPLSTAYKLFDKLCFGSAPDGAAGDRQPRNIERIARADLLGYVQRQYTGANVVVGVAGRVDLDAIVDAAAGGVRGDAGRRREPRRARRPTSAASRRGARPGYSQTHVVLGYPDRRRCARRPPCRRRSPPRCSARA